MEDEPTPRRRASDFVPETEVPPVPEVAKKTLSAAEEIKRTLRGLVIATVVLYLAMVGVAFYVYSNSRDNTKALCAIRHDAQVRVTESQAFLNAHPNGFLGLSASQLQQSINDSDQTVNALSGLGC